MLTDEDDGLHAAADHPLWSESRYLDFVAADGAAAGWVRLGCRVAERRAEVGVCLHLPDGGVAVHFARPPIAANTTAAGGLSLTVLEPFRRWRVRFRGDVCRLDDPAALAGGAAVLRGAPTSPAELTLETHAAGLPAVLGRVPGQVERIFLPGQSPNHYQHLVRVRGTLAIAGRRWRIDGGGAADHSWGPRNWLAKRTFRWLTGRSRSGDGFMLTCGTDATTSRAGGFVWSGGRYLDVTRLAVRTTGADGRPERLLVEAATEDGREWRMAGQALRPVPLRHRHGQEVLRIVKSPVRWTTADGDLVLGGAEWHDLQETAS